MIKIGKTYIEYREDQARLCSKIKIGSHESVLWFSVKKEQEQYLSLGRSDAFAYILLPTAMRQNLDIQSEDPMSERLHHQLHYDLIPALAAAGELYHRIRLETPVVSEPFPSIKAVATGFFGGVDSLHSVYMHYNRSEYPLTHLAVFNFGVYEGKNYHQGFEKACDNCQRFADENGLNTVFVDSNVYELLPENYIEIASFRLISFALAIQGLLSVYLLSSGFSMKDYRLDPTHAACFDPLTISCVNTESLWFYLSETGCRREEMNDIKQIILRKPFCTESEKGVRLCSNVTAFGQEKKIWYEVSNEYAPYLTDDRLDAFVVTFLFPAMKSGADIICEAPVSRKLLYQLNHHLIPMLANNIEEFHRIHVEAEPSDECIRCGHALATGWTGGVDSMYTLINMLHAEEPEMSLTHLVIANVGTFESEDNEKLLHDLVNRAKKNIAAVAGLKIVWVNSNLDKVLPEHYLSVAGYRLPAAILILQKLFRIFYNSSAYEFSRFSFVPYNSAYYEMVILPNLSTESTVFYSTGGAVSRMQKLKELSENPLAHKYLHPCIYTRFGKNCGICGKCIRTEAVLYALGTLDRFGEVFDLEKFEKNKDRILADVILHKYSQHYGEGYALLEKRGLITKRSIQLANERRAAKKIALEHPDLFKT